MRRCKVGSKEKRTHSLTEDLPASRTLKARYLAVCLLLLNLTGNEQPSAEDFKSFPSSVGVDAEGGRLEKLIAGLFGNKQTTSALTSPATSSLLPRTSSPFPPGDSKVSVEEPKEGPSPHPTFSSTSPATSTVLQRSSSPSYLPSVSTLRVSVLRSSSLSSPAMSSLPPPQPLQQRAALCRQHEVCLLQRISAEE